MSTVFCELHLLAQPAFEKRLPNDPDPKPLASVDDEQIKSTAREALKLEVALPLSELDERRLKQHIQRAVDENHGQDRPIIVLEFVRRKGLEEVAKQEKSAIGRGSEFERSLALARWLLGPTGVRARSVAFLPESLEGHAVLIALACEEIAMGPMVEIGRASIDDQAPDPLVVESYLGIARRRNLFPEGAIRNMLDPNISLFRVGLADEQIVYVDGVELEKLREQRKVLNETQLSIPGQLGNFLGQEARSWQWISHLVTDDVQLRQNLGIVGWKTARGRTAEGITKPMVLEVRGAIGTSAVNRWLRLTAEALAKEEINLIVVHIQSPGGSVDESMRLANYLADLDETKIETLAWIDSEARSDASLIAMACDSLWMSPKALLGGPGEATVSAEDVRQRFAEWEELSRKTGRSNGELYGLLSAELDLHEFSDAAGRIELGDEVIFQSRPDAARWKIGKAIAYPQGMKAEEALERRWAQQLAANLNAVAQQYGLDQLPEPRRVTPLEQWLRMLADQEWLATLLLTFSMALFWNEMTSPGLGIAGFLSMLCLLLFFWMRFLNGTAEWLEILLCIGGLLCLGVEFFVLPGFGIFGFGGFVMLVTGIVLTSQTFIVPHNDYQWSKLAVSLVQIATACSVLLVTLYIFRNQLGHLPWF